MQRKKKVTIVIPVFNEEKNIAELVRRLTDFFRTEKRYEFDVIFVENGSIDTSYSLLQEHARRDKRLRIIQLAKNVGCDGGIAAGLMYVTGDACIVMMADLQEPLVVASRFLRKWEQGFDIVYGIVRKRTAGFLRNTNSLLFYKMMNLLTHGMFPENASDFRLIDKKVYTVINAIPEHNKYFRGLTMWTGFHHTGVPFERKERFAGESKASLATVLRVAMNGVFSFSYFPLRFVSLLGVIISFVSFLLIVLYLIIFFIHGRETPGAITIILLILFLFGVLFFVLGIISEYLARIYDEVKGRPNFIVKKTFQIH